jgi:hypothetical protein
MEVNEKCREAKSSEVKVKIEVKSHLIWSAVKQIKVKGTKFNKRSEVKSVRQSEVMWSETRSREGREMRNPKGKNLYE